MSAVLFILIGQIFKSIVLVVVFLFVLITAIRLLITQGGDDHGENKNEGN